jgi:hypothetical protein
MNTEITLPGVELKTALSGLNKVAGRKPYLPVLNCIKISRQKNGLVTLQGTDLDAFATYHLESNQPGEAVDVLVPTKPNHNPEGAEFNCSAPFLFNERKIIWLTIC